MNARDPLAPVQPDEASAIGEFAARVWDEEIVPAITNYIAIPAKSPMFDAEWEKNGYLERVIRDAASWVESKQVAGLKLEVIRIEGRTPVIFFEVPATKAGGNEKGADTICLYGHLDKQPEFNGWRSDLGPWTPKYHEGLLYGRGGADDGYAVYASLTAIMALDKQGIPRPRCVGIIESCEEKWLVRPACLHRSAQAAAGQREPRGVPRQRRRQLRPALAHHQPARHGQRRADGRDLDRRRALRRLERAGAVELSDPAPGARPTRRQQDRRAAARELSLCRSGRPHRAGEGDRADPRQRSLEAFPVVLRRRWRPPRCPRRPTRCRRC